MKIFKTKNPSSLYYTGSKEPNKTIQKIIKYLQPYLKYVRWAENTIAIAFTLYCIFTNNFKLWLLLPFTGIISLYKNYFVWLWWWTKVHILQRNFYQHRRELYKLGTLYLYFKTHLPKTYHIKGKKIIIWARSPKGHQRILNRIKKQNKLNQSKEYIKL